MPEWESPRLRKLRECFHQAGMFYISSFMGSLTENVTSEMIKMKNLHFQGYNLFWMNTHENGIQRIDEYFRGNTAS